LIKRIILTVALLCVAGSYAKADEYIGQFFAQQSNGYSVPHNSGQRAVRVARKHGVLARRIAAAARHIHVGRAVVGAGGSVTRASWYGGGERLSRRTASGEVFRAGGLTAAHRTLPLGTRLVVSANGRSVVVRVNDRGPAAWTGRSLDLSRGAAVALGMIHAGTARVSYRVASL
jgi:rare lipoprotein A (peptidoglycan hydrolase)